MNVLSVSPTDLLFEKFDFEEVLKAAIDVECCVLIVRAQSYSFLYIIL